MLCVFVAKAQKIAGVAGQVINAENHPLVSASLFLMQVSDSSVTKLTIADKNGRFKFTGILPGRYYIKATLVGYKRNNTPAFVLNADTVVNIGTIRLGRAENKLDEVLVTQSPNFIENKGGKIVLNIYNSVLSAGSNALEILRRAPDVKVDNEDNILLNGKPDVLILIDNKPAYLTGSALAALLQSTQSSIIDKIELISNPNSGYEAGGTGGVINIRLKHNKSLGLNVTVNGNAGIIQPGSGYPSAGKAGAGININCRSNKLNIFGNYTFSDMPVQRSYFTSRLVNYNNVTDQINVDWFYNYRRQAHNYRLGADYYLSPKQVIGVLVNGSFFNQNGPKITSSGITGSHGVDSTISTYSGLTRYQANATFNVNYKNSFNNNELTIDADYVNYVKHYNELIQSNYFLVNSNTPYRNMVFTNASPSNYGLYVFTAGYHISISKTDDFSAGVKSSFIRTDNFSDFGQVVNNTYMANPAFTSQFKYTENINAANADYTHLFNKNWNMEIGLRLEQTISDGRMPGTSEDVLKNYVDIFPNLQLNNKINNDNRLGLTFSRRISRPVFESLNPLLTYVDQYTYQIGNPYLNPYYSNTLELTHTFKNRFTTKLTTAIINGFTQTIFMQNDVTQIITLKKINLGNRYNYGLIINDPFTFTSWYSVDFSGSALYQKFTGADDLDSGSPDVTLSILQHFQLPYNLKFELSGQYETPTTFGIFSYKQNVVFSAGISKSILHKRGMVSLTADDIFNSDKIIYTSHYQNLNISGNQKNSFRLIQFNFAYGFGSQAIKSARKRTTGSEEEQSRASTGGN